MEGRRILFCSQANNPTQTKFGSKSSASLADYRFFPCNSLLRTLTRSTERQSLGCIRLLFYLLVRGDLMPNQARHRLYIQGYIPPVSRATKRASARNCNLQAKTTSDKRCLKRPPLTSHLTGMGNAKRRVGDSPLASVIGAASTTSEHRLDKDI